MPKNKLLVKFFSSGLQAAAVQVLGGLFFYLISVYLTKDSFGLISWMNAVCLFITTLLGCGLEQVVIRRIAASKSDWAAAAFFFHSLAGFIAVFLILLGLTVIFKNSRLYQILPWFFAAQGLVYIGVPLKQYLNAKENFTPYGVIAVISNLAKITAAYVLIQKQHLEISSVIWVLIATAAFELFCLLIYLLAKTQFSFKLQAKAYVKLLKESSAQYLSVIFDMSLSRMDWIMLGLLATNAVLADYSFAYRAFELARLPMVVIAPIILPRLSRLMASGNRPGAEHQRQINLFNSTEMFLVMLIPLILNIIWVPLVSMFTHGKYGESNSWQFLLLSLCIPFQLFINLLWSLSFGAKKYRQVTTITICSAVINIVLNILLIPHFKGLGAAGAFLITTLLQSLLYYRLVYRDIMVISLKPLVFFLLTATVVYLASTQLHVHFVLQLMVAVAVYLLAAILTGQMGKKHLKNVKQFLS